jgi:hypothetical protein
VTPTAKESKTGENKIEQFSKEREKTKLVSEISALEPLL